MFQRNPLTERADAFYAFHMMARVPVRSDDDPPFPHTRDEPGPLQHHPGRLESSPAWRNLPS